jgi:hypothetical protein
MLVAGAGLPDHILGMVFTPYLLGFSLVAFVLCYGLMRRPAWMWYFGWLFFYLIAARFGHIFFSQLIVAENSQQMLFSCIYLAGGLLVWMPAVLWWCGARSKFGRSKDDKTGVSS